MVPRDWTLHDVSPTLSIAALIDLLPGGVVHLRVRYVDHRTDEEGEIDRVAPTLSDCIHEVGRAIRSGSVSGRPARPLTADAVVDALWRHASRHRAAEREKGAS